MIAKKLDLLQFRNIAEASVSFSPKVTILYGNNGQGKTNLLEALHYFSGGKSFRGARDRQLLRFDEAQARIGLSFCARERDFLQTVSLFPDKKKEQTLNGLGITRQGELTGLFCTVLFTPEHLTLVKDGPAQRRRFLDMAICQLRPKYGAALLEYQRILNQKNVLLKDLHQNLGLLDTLDIWNERLASVGSYLSLMRGSYLKKLGCRAQEYQRDISGGKELLQVAYRGFSQELPETAGEIKALFLKKLEEARKEELQNAWSIVGPHRDDILLSVDGREARCYASQGQQRSCVLAMKLAEGDAVLEATGEEPVYLFDDILSELDSSRQSYVLRHIEGKQVLITCCEKEQFQKFEDGKIFLVEHGTITEQ